MMEIEEAAATHFPFNPSIQQCSSMEEAISSLETTEEPFHLDNSTCWEIRLMEIESDLFLDLTASISPSLEEEHDEHIISSSISSRVPSLLLMGAEAIDAENYLLCSSVIAELMTHHQSNNLSSSSSSSSSPLERLAWFFTQGLIHKNKIGRLRGANRIDQRHFAESSVSSPAFHILQELSPYIKFGHFAANQAILEACSDRRNIRVVDFDINEGLQWPPLMADLAGSFPNLDSPSSFKLTALILPNASESVVHQTGRRLKEYADSINLPFEFDAIHISDLETVRVEPGQALISNCMIHQLHSPNRNFTLVNTFLASSVKLSPRLVVLVEEELFSSSSKAIPSMPFADFFCEAIEHYGAISESLAADGRIRGEGLEMMEKDVVGRRVVSSLVEFPCGEGEKLGWEDGFESLRCEFKAAPFSPANVAQANYLVSLFGGGFWVQHERCRLGLCWKSRVLATASIWVPKSERKRRLIV